MKLTKQEKKLIKTMRAEAERKKAEEWYPVALADISKHEKLELFDQVYEAALRKFHDLRRLAIQGELTSGAETEQAKHFYEVAMTLLLGDKVFSNGVDPFLVRKEEPAADFALHFGTSTFRWGS